MSRVYSFRFIGSVVLSLGLAAITVGAAPHHAGKHKSKSTHSAHATGSNAAAPKAAGSKTAGHRAKHHHKPKSAHHKRHKHRPAHNGSCGTGGGSTGGGGGEGGGGGNNGTSTVELFQLGTSLADYARAIQVEASGNLWLASNDSGGPALFTLLPDGTVEGSVRLPAAFSAAIDSAGNTYTTSGPGLTRTVTKLDASGATLWQSLSGPGESGFVTATETQVALGAMQVDSAGNVVFGVTTWDASTGQLKWMSEQTEALWPLPGSVAIAGVDTPSPGHVAALATLGEFDHVDIPRDLALFMFTSTGELISRNPIDANVVWPDGDLEFDRNGHLIVVGSRDNGGFVQRRDELGNLLWSRAFPDVVKWEQAVIDGSGSILVAGTYYPNAAATDTDVVVQKLDAAGYTVWSEVFGTTSTETVADLVLDSSGNAYVLGTTLGALGGPSAGQADVFVAKIGAEHERDESTPAPLFDPPLPTGPMQTSTSGAECPELVHVAIVDGQGSVASGETPSLWLAEINSVTEITMCPGEENGVCTVTEEGALGYLEGLCNPAGTSCFPLDPVYEGCASRIPLTSINLPAFYVRGCCFSGQVEDLTARACDAPREGMKCTPTNTCAIGQCQNSVCVEVDTSACET